MHHYVGAAVGGGFDQVFGRHDRQVADFCQFLNRQLRVAFRGVQRRPDCCRTQVHFQQQLGGAMQVAGFFFQQHAERMEFLAQRHWHRILQLGAPHFQNGFKLFCLAVKPFAQLVDGVDKLLIGGVNRNAETGWVGVVGRLALVEMIVRVQVLVFAFLVAHQLQTNIRQHFVGVHVQ